MEGTGPITKSCQLLGFPKLLFHRVFKTLGRYANLVSLVILSECTSVNWRMEYIVSDVTKITNYWYMYTLTLGSP